jgi:hypothetical protein
VLVAGTALRDVDVSRNAISGSGLLAIAIALEATEVKKVRLNNQSKSGSSDAEAALVNAAKLNQELVCDWSQSRLQTKAPHQQIAYPSLDSVPPPIEEPVHLNRSVALLFQTALLHRFQTALCITFLNCFNEQITRFMNSLSEPLL